MANNDWATSRASRRNDYGCQKCGDGFLGGHDLLFGVYPARVCVNCRKDWAGYFSQQPLYKQIHDLSIARAVEIQTGNTEKATALNDEITGLYYGAFWQLADQWVSEVIERNKPADGDADVSVAV